jgi:Flp pilus assembly protein TadB
MTAVALALGAGVGFGLFLIASGWKGRFGPPVIRRPVTSRLPELERRAGLALGVAAVTAILTRWPVAVLAGAALGAFLPDLLSGQAEREAAIARTEAIATWTEMLRDTLSGAHGLEEVITATAPMAPAPIRDEVSVLATRITHQRLPSALRHFADDLADPTADLVVAALVLAARGSPRALAELLGTLALAARDDASMRRRVEATRARARSTVQIVTALTVVMMAGLLVFNRSYLDPYHHPLGQLVLALVCGLFGLGLWWLARMARFVSPERFLAAPPASEIGEAR